MKEADKNEVVSIEEYVILRPKNGKGGFFIPRKLAYIIVEDGEEIIEEDQCIQELI